MKYYALSFFLSLLIVFSSVAEEPKFLTLPLPNQAVVANGWAYGSKSLGDRAGHYAIDYDVATGTSVIAAADGYAMKSYQIEDGYGYGHMVVIRHNEKNSEGEYFYTLYAHLSEVMEKIPNKSRGTIHDGTDVIAANWQLVKRGDEIGKSGTSGGQTWQHLHFVPFAGNYKKRTTQKSYDPYGLYKQPIGEDSSTYYPPVVYLDESKNIYEARYSSNKRQSGKKYTHSGTNRLWITDPPFPPVFVHPIGGKTSGTLRIQGLNFGENKGTVRLSYSYESDRLAASQAKVEILTPTAIQWTDTEIQMELFQLKFELNGADWGWDSFNTPILVELFKQSGEKISEFWYPFVDVKFADWYLEAVMKLWKMGILNGVKEGGYWYFKPHENITRAAFLKILVESYERSYDETLPSEPGQNSCDVQNPPACQAIMPFLDVRSSKEWFYQYVLIAYKRGWIEGKSSFNPHGSITRAQAAKLLVKAKGLEDHPYKQSVGYRPYTPANPTEPRLSENEFFSDVKDMSAWYYPFVYRCKEAGIFKGFSDGSFKPNKTLTRAESAQVIYKSFFSE